MSLYQTWKYTSRPADKKGFTLVEIAIVLVILGLIIGTLAPLMMSMIKRDKLKSGRQTVQRARDEIIGYAMINGGRLPALSNLAHRQDPWGNQLFLKCALPPSTVVCNATSTNMVIIPHVLSNDACSPGKKFLVACIVASNGPNYRPQIVIHKLNKLFQVKIFDYGCIDKAGVPFDDVYEYLSLEELKARVCQPSSNSTSSSGP